MGHLGDINACFTYHVLSLQEKGKITLLQKFKKDANLVFSL